MTDAELSKRVTEFFHRSEAGAALRARWERRVANWVDELIAEENDVRKTRLQARIECYRQVFKPELGDS